MSRGEIRGLKAKLAPPAIRAQTMPSGPATIQPQAESSATIPASSSKDCARFRRLCRRRSRSSRGTSMRSPQTVDYVTVSASRSLPGDGRDLELINRRRWGSHLACDPHADPQSIAWQIGERHVLDVNGLKARTIRAGGHRALPSLRFGQRDRLGAAEVAIDLVGLATDLRYCGTHRVGAVAVPHPDHLCGPGYPIGHEKGGTADRNQRQIAGFGLHSVDRILDLPLCLVEDGAGEIARQRSDSFRIANLYEAGRDRRIGSSRCLAAEDEGVAGQPIADALRPHGERIPFDDAAAAEPNRQQIRHPEEGA